MREKSSIGILNAPGLSGGDGQAEAKAGLLAQRFTEKITNTFPDTTDTPVDANLAAVFPLLRRFTEKVTEVPGSNGSETLTMPIDMDPSVFGLIRRLSESLAPALQDTTSTPIDMDASVFSLARRLTGSLVDALSDEETSANYVPVDMGSSAISTTLADQARTFLDQGPDDKVGSDDQGLEHSWWVL